MPETPPEIPFTRATTSNGLPVVSPRIPVAFAENIITGDRTFADLEATVREENPVYAMWIDQFAELAERDISWAASELIRRSGFGGYGILNQQAAADKLRQNFPDLQP